MYKKNNNALIESIIKGVRKSLNEAIGAKENGKHNTTDQDGLKYTKEGGRSSYRTKKENEVELQWAIRVMFKYFQKLNPRGQYDYIIVRNSAIEDLKWSEHEDDIVEVCGVANSKKRDYRDDYHEVSVNYVNVGDNISVGEIRYNTPLSAKIVWFDRTEDLTKARLGKIFGRGIKSHVAFNSTIVELLDGEKLWGVSSYINEFVECVKSYLNIYSYAEEFNYEEEPEYYPCPYFANTGKRGGAVNPEDECDGVCEVVDFNEYTNENIYRCPVCGWEGTLKDAFDVEDGATPKTHSHYTIKRTKAVEDYEDDDF